jgi:transposase-like protein
VVCSGEYTLFPLQTNLPQVSKKTCIREFKKEAVRLALKNGSVTETARSLGLQVDLSWPTRVYFVAARRNRRRGIAPVTARKSGAERNGRDLEINQLLLLSQAQAAKQYPPA